MSLGRLMAASMRMDEATWARHASPWSVWTRVPILPALALAIYARVWIGGWALVPVAAVLVWTLANPRAFPPPRDDRTWATRGVLGERMWLARRRHPIPAHHVRAATALLIASALGLPVLAYGLAVLDPWATASGTLLTSGAKLWFVDRMAWLYDETRRDGTRHQPGRAAAPGPCGLRHSPAGEVAGDRSGGCHENG